MSIITVPEKMYNDLLSKGLYQSIRARCLQEFIALNDISSAIIRSDGDLSLVGTVIMEGDNSDILVLIDHNILPIDSSRIIIDDNDEFGLRKYYDETYNMEDKYKYVPDLVMIAHECSYDFYTKVIDTIFARPPWWTIEGLQSLIYDYLEFVGLFGDDQNIPSNENISTNGTNDNNISSNGNNSIKENSRLIVSDILTNELVSDDILTNDELSDDNSMGNDVIWGCEVVDEPKKESIDICFRYLLRTLQKIGILSDLINSNYIVQHAYDIYEKTKNPIIFRILFEYGVSPDTYVQEWKDRKLSWLIENDPVIAKLYQPGFLTKRAM